MGVTTQPYTRRRQDEPLYPFYHRRTGLINTIRTDGKILSEEYLENGTLIDAIADKKVIHLAQVYMAE